MEALLAVLREVREKLAQPGNDFTWSSWDDQAAATAELDHKIAQIARGEVPPLLGVLFAPTGPIQEVAVASGWGDTFLDLANRYDDAIAAVRTADANAKRVAAATLPAADTRAAHAPTADAPTAKTRAAHAPIADAPRTPAPITLRLRKTKPILWVLYGVAGIFTFGIVFVILGVVAVLAWRFDDRPTRFDAEGIETRRGKGKRRWVDVVDAISGNEHGYRGAAVRWHVDLVFRDGPRVRFEPALFDNGEEALAFAEGRLGLRLRRDDEPRRP